MHILITTFTFHPQKNGVSNVAYQHAIGFLERGFKVTVATRYDPQRKTNCYPEGLKVVQFKIDGNYNLRSRYKGELDKYLDFIAEFNGDIICCHCWQIWSTDLAVKAFKNSSAKKVLVSHGVSANSRYSWPRTILTWLLWRPYVWKEMPSIIRSFDHVIFLSNKCDKDRFYDHYLANKLNYTNVSIIPNGADFTLDQDCSKSFRKKYSIKEKILLLCVGKYTKEKNEIMVLKAYLSTKIENSILIFIGPSFNEYSKNLTKYFSRSGKKAIGKDLLLLSSISRDEIKCAYKEADLFLNGSKSEYFPLVILESIACGTPFVSSDVGCVDQIPGGIVAKGAMDMSKNIQRIIENEELRVTLSQEAVQASQNLYNWDNIIDEYCKLFNCLLGDEK